MPLTAFIVKRFNRSTSAIIEQANSIINEYQAQGFTLTLRQIYYKFIARDLFPVDWIDEDYNKKHRLDPATKNTVKNYKRLGSILNDGRLAGRIDWDAIEDRTRGLASQSHWEEPTDIISACGSQFKVDKWSDQDFRPEVWIEKEALSGVFEGICNKLDIPYLSCRGYTSQSEMYGSAMRIKSIIEGGQTPFILHFGDHDPSGMDMTRDIQDRMEVFKVAPDFRRLALNMVQIKKFQCPPNPAKETDSRFVEYEKKFGDKSWELDALEPKALTEIVEREVLKVRDEKKWDRRVAYEAHCREEISFAADNWELVQKAMQNRKNRKRRK